MDGDRMSASRDMVLKVLASGSSGNSTYVEIAGVKLLVDAGISARRIMLGLSEIGVDVAELDAIFVTHEHIDHIRGLETLLARAPRALAFATRGTARACRNRLGGSLGLQVIQGGWSFGLGPVTVTPFEISHDSNEPVGFRFESSASAIGVVTDLGQTNSDVRHSLFDLQALVVESNHDLKMLKNGPYPARLKRRIASTRGHLSNQQTRKLIKDVMGPRLEAVVLAHLSEENNEQSIALESAKGALEGSATNAFLATREGSDLFTFAPSAPIGRPQPPPRSARQGMLPFDQEQWAVPS